MHSEGFTMLVSVGELEVLLDPGIQEGRVGIGVLTGIVCA